MRWGGGEVVYCMGGRGGMWGDKGFSFLIHVISLFATQLSINWRIPVYENRNISQGGQNFNVAQTLSNFK